MTIAIITHNHDGIRINIDGVVTFACSNAAYLAEAHARLIINARDGAAVVNLVADELRSQRNLIPQLLVTHDETPEPIKQFLHELADKLDSLAAAVVDLQRKVG